MGLGTDEEERSYLQEMERIYIENEEILHLSRYQKASFTPMTELNGKKICNLNLIDGHI